MAKPSLSDPITLRLPLDVLQVVEGIADASERTRTWVIIRALKLYMAGEGRELLAAIEEGRRREAAGQSHAMDAVRIEMDAIVGGNGKAGR